MSELDADDGAELASAEPTPEELAALEEAFSGELDDLLSRAHGDAERTMEPGRLDVLARVRAQVDAEEGQRRRGRRRALRALFYLFNLAAVVLIVVAYLGNRMAIKVLEINARRLATRTELTALTRALVRYVQERPADALPQDLPAVLRALDAKAPSGGRYYPFDPARRRGDDYLDDFGHPYRYLLSRERALIYSVGPNGLDEGGAGDDVVDQWVTFVR
ncbi:MAG: hypothetical protein AB7N76_18620 [Planctomycetota bacterium]